MSDLGTRIRNLRIKKGLKQEDLAKFINISKSAIGMYERNEREPSFEILKTLAEFFDVSIDFLLTGNDYKRDKKENLFFFDIEGLNDEEIEDIKRHIEYVKWKAKQERGNK